MKNALVLILLLLVLTATGQDKFTTSNALVSFYSQAPVADVDARNDNVKAALNTSNGELTFTIDMNDFQFQNAKMGRDAQKNYIEIDKYPRAGFKGKLTGDIDFKKNGTYKVAAQGKLNVHGVENEINEKGTVIVKDDKIVLECEFHVALKDHNIETPKILGQEMTADKVLVKVKATLSPQINAASKD